MDHLTGRTDEFNFQRKIFRAVVAQFKQKGIAHGAPFGIFGDSKIAVGIGSNQNGFAFAARHHVKFGVKSCGGSQFERDLIIDAVAGKQIEKPDATLFYKVGFARVFASKLVSRKVEFDFNSFFAFSYFFFSGAAGFAGAAAGGVSSSSSSLSPVL